MDPRRKRLLFRSRHMGTNENDIFFGAFAERHLADFSDDQLGCYEALLAENDPDLFDWATGRKAPPARHDHDVMALLQSFLLVKP
jgi:antitoxin CptB